MSDVLVNIKRELEKSPPIDKIMRAIASDLFATVNQRVFFYGKLSSGGDPAPYSTKPLYASTKISSKLSPLGKNGKGKFKNGKQKKSRYIPGGYKELKEKIGRKNRFDFTGQLKKAFSFQRLEKNIYVLGFIGTQRWGASHKLLVSTTHEEIVEGLEDKYGAIFDLTKDEIARVDQIVERELDLILNALPQ